MSKKIDLSIILPAYNEERIVKKTLQILAKYIADHRNELGVCEVILVTSGQDATAQVAESCTKEFDTLRVIANHTRVTKGRAVRMGVQAARGNVITFMDVDLSTPLHHLPSMVRSLQADADVVIGARRLSRIHKGLLRSLLSVASNLLIRTVLFGHYRDTQCGFKGFKASVARTLFATQTVQGWGFDLELLQYAKEHHFKVRQLSIDDWHETREEDFSGDRLGGAAVNTLKDLSVVRVAAWGRSLVRHWKLCLGLALAISFILSLWIGSLQSVWFDEAYSITLAQQSYERLIALTAVDAHPPLYYVALKAWTSFWGMSDITMRLLSVICASLAAGAGLLLVKRLFGVRTMLVAIPFVVLAPFLLRYGFEIRMYAMASLICVLATHAMLSALEATNQKRRRLSWLAYAVLVALGMYTLYYTALVWIAHLVWLSWQARRAHRRAPLIRQPWILAFIGSVVLYVPWLPTFIDQMSHSALSGVGERVTYVQFVSIVSMMFSFKAHWQLDAWAALAILLAIIGIIYAVVTAWRATNEQNRHGLMLLLIVSLLPVAFLMLASMPPLRPMFLERYVSHFIIFTYLLVGVSLALAFKARKAKIAVIAVFLVGLLVQGLFTFYTMGNFTFERIMRPHARDVAKTIGSCGPGDLVIAGDPLLYFEMHYHLPQCDMWFFEGTQPIGSRGGYAILHNSPNQYFVGAPISASRIYFVHTRDDGQLPFALPDAYKEADSRNFEKFHLVIFDRAY